MKNFFSKIVLVLTALIVVQMFALTIEAAPPKGIPAGGKGATGAAAIEDMKLSTFKKVLAQITERSDDPNSPYQQLLREYESFIPAVHVDRRGKNSAGHFVTGRVEIRYPELQARLGEIVRNLHVGDETRAVYLFVRFVGDVTEEQRRAAENIILQRYMTRLKENRFLVANADSIVGQLGSTRSMNFDQFVEFVKKLSAENPEICTAIVGEIRMAKVDEHSDGTAKMTCEMRIQSLDALNNFYLIEGYEGDEEWTAPSADLNRFGQFLFEKAAVTSSKSITDSLVKYWAGK